MFVNKWAFISTVFVVQLCTIESCSAKDLRLPAVPAEVNGSSDQEETRSDFNCYDHDGIGYIGDIPHPSDCTHYLACTETFDGVAVAKVMPCVENTQFHLDSCRCEWPDVSKCFQAGHDFYETNRLQCAEQLIK